MVDEVDKTKKHSVNFAVISRNASKMTLCLFQSSLKSQTASLVSEITLDPELNKTGDVWHIQVDDLSDLESLYYGWKADGALGWEGGSRFHPKQVLLDPFSHHVKPLELPGVSDKTFLGSLGELRSAPSFDWEEVVAPRRGFEDLRVAEMDFGVFIKDPGMIKILSETGVNGVVLKGVLLSSPGDPSNSPLSFSAPNTTLLGTLDPLECSQQLKGIIKELHKNSIEVLMEVRSSSKDPEKTGF